MVIRHWSVFFNDLNFGGPPGRLGAPLESRNHRGVKLETVCFLLADAAGVDNIMTVTVHRCKRLAAAVYAANHLHVCPVSLCTNHSTISSSDRAIVEQHDRQDSSARSASMTAAAMAMMTMMTVSIMRKKI